MAQLKIYEMNRKKYEKIKEMDRHEAEVYLKDVYEAGAAAGQQAASSFDMEICLAAVSEIRGIGPEKLKQIRLAMIAAGAKETKDL